MYRAKYSLACGRAVSYFIIYRDPDIDLWIQGRPPVEALLSGRTVFGDPSEVKEMRREGSDVLSLAKTKFTEMQCLIEIIQDLALKEQDFEVIIASPSMSCVTPD